MRTTMRVLLERILFESPEIRGEYWIDDNGSLMFADGDVGDYNHEGYVIQSLISGILNEIGVYNDEMPIEDALEDDRNKEAVYGYLEIETPEQEAEFVDSPVDYLYKKMIEFGYTHNGVPATEVIGIIQERGDARELAMKYWGWKRLAGTSVQTWYMTSKDLRIIADGINEVFDTEGMLDNEEEMEALGSMEFDIEVYAAQRVYRGVPWSVIETKNPSLLKDYAGYGSGAY